MNIFYVSIQRYQKNPTTKKNDRLGPQSSQPRPRVSGHCPTSWALNGGHTVDGSLQVNTPEVENSSPQKSDEKTGKGRFVFFIFSLFFSGAMSFLSTKSTCFTAFNWMFMMEVGRVITFSRSTVYNSTRKFFNQYLVWKNLVPSTIPAAFLKKNDTHHRPPRLWLNQVAGRWSCHPPRSRFHCRPSQRSPSLAQSSGYLGWMIRRDWWKPMESWNAENACFFVLYGNKS